MVTCPENNSDRSVLARNNKAYKTEAYKTSNKLFKKRKIKNLIAVEKTSSITESSVKKPIISIVVNSIEAEIIETETKAKSIAIINRESVKSLEMEIEEPILTASITPQGVSGVDNNLADNSIEISDIVTQATVPLNIIKKNSNKDIRIQKRKDIREKKSQFFNDVGISRPAIGMAVAGFVLSLIGLIVFGIPLGILSVIFSGIALAKLQTNPRQTGRGLAIAGLVIGIADIVVVALLLAAAM